MTSGRVRRFDPERRDRIIDSCLRVIAEQGVAGASHRTIAAAADVPLGSMTYHFSGMDELLHEAFERFTTSVSDRFEERMAQAGSADEAREAVVRTILDAADPRETVLSHELYTLAAREPSFRDLTHGWMARSRRGLERHFDPETARLLDALIEGLQIHRALDTQERDPSDARIAVARLTHAATGPTPAAG
ncbi:TetR/AcrR family transcriptional regulator [Actinotalea sp.]|uniref:TetR/AcrR family transcriptional regulator n=1 Tax=Actinotalea sp. TaxID=1872145 RepID=UPI003563A003